MNETIVIVAGLLILSLVSGMLGLGVAFAAVPFLSLFMTDLVHEVQPLSLLLNGITAAFAAVGFAKSGLIDWRKALTLAAVTTVFAPLGSLLAQSTPANVIWVVYLVAVGYLATGCSVRSRSARERRTSGSRSSSPLQSRSSVGSSASGRVSC